MIMSVNQIQPTGINGGVAGSCYPGMLHPEIIKKRAERRLNMWYRYF